MIIRKAQINDLERILEIYDLARAYMRANGNHKQWPVGTPAKETLVDDIAKGQLYVGEDDIIRFVFAYIPGEDPTYGYIEGAWLNDEPYATIHRIASDGSVKGVLRQVVSFIKRDISNIRIDTHEDNKTMQRTILNNGFKRCGIIYLENGDPRIAYQLTDEDLQ
jgi:hypothetical protein